MSQQDHPWCIPELREHRVSGSKVFETQTTSMEVDNAIFKYSHPSHNGHSLYCPKSCLGVIQIMHGCSSAWSDCMILAPLTQMIEIPDRNSLAIPKSTGVFLPKQLKPGTLP